MGLLYSEPSSSKPPRHRRSSISSKIRSSPKVAPFKADKGKTAKLREILESDQSYYDEEEPSEVNDLEDFKSGDKEDVQMQESLSSDLDAQPITSNS